MVKMRELIFIRKSVKRNYFKDQFFKKFLIFSAILFLNLNIYSQCTPNPHEIVGKVYNDLDFNGQLENTDGVLEGVNIMVFDSHQQLIGEATTSSDGSYVVNGLTDGADYRLEFSYPEGFFQATGQKNVRFVKSPACSVDLLLQRPIAYAPSNPDIAMTMFYQGTPDKYGSSSVVSSTSSNFNILAARNSIAKKSEIGSVWGLAFSRTTQQLFTSAFVKQYIYLGDNGFGAIYSSRRTKSGWETSLFVDLVNQGIDLGNMAVTDAHDCDYGAQVGKIGIGAIALSDDEKYLYAVNIHKNELVKIPLDKSKFSEIEEIAVPNPNCKGGLMHTFALKSYKGKLYIGVTCGAEFSKKESESEVFIYEYNPVTGDFAQIFETNYSKGYFHDNPSFDVNTQHWITDIDFTDEGNMVIALNDRVGQRYCRFYPQNPAANARLDVQNGDILLVWNNAGVWELENNGRAGILSGTGIGNGQGPGGGEFFAKDAWTNPRNPELHKETVTGSLFVLEGTGEVIVPVYDPMDVSYSGGIKKFDTANGQQTGVYSIYSHKTFPEMGKASPFGDVDAIYDPLPVEIGDVVWLDKDNDGIQDPGEKGISGLEVSLYNDTCDKVGSTTTDTNGNYVFNDSNVDLDGDGIMDGIDILEKYYVVIDDNGFANDRLEKDSKIYYLTILNKGFGANKDNNDNDGQIARNVCHAFDGKPYVEVMVGGSGENRYDVDFGFSEVKIFDLALRKTVVDNKTVHYGDMVTFKVTVYNQGTINAHDIVVTDYINKGYEVNPIDNPTWQFIGGDATFKYTSVLKPGDSFDAYIIMKVMNDASLDELVNYAEISSALDPDNKLGEDVDSSPDSIRDNDIGGIPYIEGNNSVMKTDDLIDDDGTFDEDDQDPAVVKILDLALQKVVVNTKDVFVIGDTVTFKFNIFNQGNVVVTKYSIVDYLDDNLIFSPELNNGWTINANNLPEYTIDEELPPFENKSIFIKMIISDNAKVDEILNYGEISAFETKDERNPRDYDSVPNQIKEDDAGAQVGTSTDNQVNSSPLSLIADEDDQDVASITIYNYDLALTKKALDHNIGLGDDVEFEIEVFNQGIITADKITIVDYLDEGFVLNDPNWSIYPGDNSRAEITLSVANGLLPATGLLPNTSVKIKIKMNLAQLDATTNFLTNVAEIKSSYDISGNNLGIYDKDSTPDDIKDNDKRGADNQIDDDGTTDEDDHDWATVFVRSSLIFDPCVCLHNATNEDDGQFGITITIISPSGENWKIDSVVNFFDIASPPPPPAPLLYTVGTVLTEVVNNPAPGLSAYTINGVQIDDIGYYVRFINNLGDIEIMDMTSGFCSYDDIVVSGATGTCQNSSEDYSIVGADPTTTYTWTLPGGGGAFSGANVGTDVAIDWGGVNGTFDLVITPTGGTDCIAPKTLKIKVGSSSGALAIEDYVIGSVDLNCELKVTPETIITTPVDPNTPFKVILISPDGTMLPSDVITSDYIGMDIMVKIIDQCSGQQGMSIIKAIDKQKPVFTCVDAVVECDKVADFKGPEVADNCDSDPEVIFTDEVIENQDCTEPYTKIITRTYVATDKWGNQSKPCVQNISVSRLDKTQIEFPQNYLVSDNSALTCNAFEVDSKGNPAPSVTGTPTYHGKDMYTICTNNFCEITVGYNDFVVKDDGCIKSIIRTWHVLENCETVTPFSFITHIQTIEIFDRIPPIPVAPHNLYFTTDGLDCSATVDLPALEITDNCSTEFTVNVFYPGGSIMNSNGGRVTLPVGENTINYKIYDKCGNLSEVDLKVTVVDKTPPIAICQTNTIVSLSSGGEADVSALSFNSGSYDDCGLKGFEVRRMFNDDFGNTVHFGCDDLDSTDIMVVLKVIDNHDNINSCMVTVNVQHKYPPRIECPDNLIKECDFPYDPDSLPKYFGTAIGFDVCGVTVTEDDPVFRFTNCGTGYIKRHFVATGRGGLQRDCYQKISFENSNPFTIDDITWPKEDYTSNECGVDDLSPDITGWPVLNEDQCDLVSMNYSDQTFFGIQDSACYSIVRTWTVLDECQKIKGEFKKWHFDQIIHVVNSVDPTIEPLVDIDTCTLDSECKSGFVTLEAFGDDDCTAADDLQWTYSIDLYNDGMIDTTVHQVGHKAIASGQYPIGTHSIIWQVEDRCGNSFARSQFFTIKNCKKPTAICKDKVIVELGPTLVDGDTTGVADILAELFDNKSFHSCGSPLKVSYSLDVNDTILDLDCSWLRQTDWEIKIYVTDTFGNYDYCTTHLEVQDNHYICNPLDRCIAYPPDSIVIEACNPDLDPAGDLLDSLTVNTSCGCDTFAVSFSDTDLDENVYKCGGIERTWTIDFGCEDLDTTVYYVQTIIVKNSEAPDLICGSDVIVNITDATKCEAYANIPIPTYDADCNTGLVVTHNSTFADHQGIDASGTYPGGTTTVTFTLTDDCSNTSQCSLDVIVNDPIDPICVSNDTTVALDANGNVVITGDFVGSGSTDNCSVASVTVVPNSFGCSDIGDHDVTITVTDGSGNTSNCTATVTIIDTLTQLCNAHDTILYLDANGIGVLNPEDIYSGSGGCGGSSDVSLQAEPNTFDCGDLGENTVQLIVTDNVTGEKDTCDAIVTVVDTVAPTCLVQDYTVNLDADGNGTITFDNINNGSNDACGIADTLLSDSSFDCSDLGASQTVTVTLTDGSSNSSECNANITVVDLLSPQCVPNDTTVALDANGTVNITGDFVGSGSTDNCSVDTITVDPDNFNCDDIGDNDVTITVTDGSGNTSTCTAIVTIIDTLTQLCNAHDTILILDENGFGVLDPEDIYSGSGGCGGSNDVTLVAEPDTFGCDDLGENIVQLIVTDNVTGEMDTCDAIVTVVDTIAPQCLVNNDTIYLDDNGGAFVSFDDIDNGSFDPCGVIVDTTLSKEAFDCEDTDAIYMDTVTLTDNSGNISTCISEITVLDTIAPVCNAVDTLFVPLDETGMAVITGQNVDAGSFDQCQFISLEVDPDTFYCNDAGLPIVFTLTVSDASGNQSMCSGIIMAQDTTAPTITCPNDTTVSCLGVPDQSDFGAVFGEPVISDNCSQGGDYVETDIINIDNCGDGAITRNFMITDPSGNSDNCTQFITVEAEEDNFSESDITWPEDTIVVENCFSIDPDSLGSKPIINTDNAGCADITTTYEDTNLTPGGDCNDTIQRIWTVVDSCKFDMDPNTGIFIDTQTIIVFDTLAPMIFLPNDTIVNIEDLNCSNDDTINLFGYVVDCDPDVVVTNNSPFAFDNNSADATGVYPEGEWTIIVTATDQCGNTSTDSFNLQVIYPTYCQKTRVYITENKDVVLYVDDALADHPDCWDMSFSNTDPTLDSLIFDCDDVPNDILTDIYKYDLDGNLIDSCQSIVTVLDPNGFCNTFLVAGITGTVSTEGGNGVENAGVVILGNDNRNLMTDVNGSFEFMPIESNGSYIVKPKKDNDIRNGLNTLDIINIQKHILGIHKLNSPYKIIAADVNNSSRITASDILNLRKVILGDLNEFENNESWKFIDSKYKFINKNKPLLENYPKDFKIEKLTNNVKVDFVGVKIGDVDGSAIANSKMALDLRNEMSTTLHVENAYLEKGEIIEVPVVISQKTTLYGMQFTLNFDKEYLEYQEIEGQEIEIDDNNIGLKNLARGLFTFSWDAIYSKDFEKNTKLFLIRFKVKKSGILGGLLNITDDITPRMAIVEGEKVENINLEFRNKGEEVFILYQNEPNPWSFNTKFNFDLPSSGEVKVKITNSLGAVIDKYTIAGKQGPNSITLEKNRINHTGVLFVDFEFKGEHLVKRMIKIK